MAKKTKKTKNTFMVFETNPQVMKNNPQVIENNPQVRKNNVQVINKLAYQLGLSEELAFYDIYSLNEPDLLAQIPRPAYALIVIIPLSESWNEFCEEEDGPMEIYNQAGPEEPVVWFKQTIGHACGSVALLHALLNGPFWLDYIKPESDLENLLYDAIPRRTEGRAKVLAESEAFAKAQEATAQLGDTIPSKLGAAEKLHQHFVTFVKANDGHLWELEGSRKGPIDRGALKEEEDVLSERALSLSVGRLMDIERDAGGDLRFTCIVLACKSESE